MRERKQKSTDSQQNGCFFYTADPPSPPPPLLPISTGIVPKITNSSQIFRERNLLEINNVKMATVGFEISHYAKGNGTKSVRLRLSHNGKSKYFNSGIFVHCDDISRNGNVKDKAVLSQICDLVATYTNRITAHAEQISRCSSINEIYRIVTQDDQPKQTDMDFFEYAERFICKKQCEKTRTGYRTMLTSFRTFIRKKTINFNDITPALLRSYIEHLNPSRRRAALYITLMKSVFNAAIKEFNDDTIVVKNPFSKIEMPKGTTPEKRGLTVDQVRAIANHKCTGKREQFAKDMFLLSFCLVGMNAIDLYDCDTIDGDTITTTCCNDLNGICTCVESEFTEEDINPSALISTEEFFVCLTITIECAIDIVRRNGEALTCAV